MDAPLSPRSPFFSSFDDLGPELRASPWKQSASTSKRVSHGHLKTASVGQLSDMESVQLRQRTRSQAEQVFRSTLQRKIRALKAYEVQVDFCDHAALEQASSCDLYGFAVPARLGDAYRQWFVSFEHAQTALCERYARVMDGHVGATLALRHSIAYHGVPASYRGLVWPLLCGAPTIPTWDESRLADMPIDPDTAAQLEKDIPRTFANSLLKARPELPQQLRSLLYLHARLFPAFGYTQGMSLLAAAVVVFVQPLPAALGVYRHFSETVCADYFCPTMIGVKADALLLDALVQHKLPVLAAHFAASQFSLILVVSRLFIPVFVGTALPSETAFRIWDLILCTGPSALFRAMLAILAHFEQQLLLVSGEIEIATHLDALMSTLFDVDALNLEERFPDVDECFVRLQRRKCFDRLHQSPAPSPSPGIVLLTPSPPRSAPLPTLDRTSPFADDAGDGESPSRNTPPKLMDISGTLSSVVGAAVSLFRSSKGALRLSSSSPGGGGGGGGAAIGSSVCFSCHERESDSRPLTPYRWVSLGETTPRMLCPPCFAQLRCSVCRKHRPDVVAEVCGDCARARK